VLPLAVRRYHAAAAVALAFLVVCVILGARLGSEFLPKLEEGNLWIRALLPPTITLEAGMESVARMRDVIKSYAPTVTVVSEQGRGDDATDPDGSFVRNSSCRSSRRAMAQRAHQAEMVRQMSEEAEPQNSSASTSIFRNTSRTTSRSGVRREGREFVKIFGRDLAELERLSKAVKAEIAQVPGVKDPGGFSLLGQPNLIVRIDRAKAARYGFASATSTRWCRPRSAARR